VKRAGITRKADGEVVVSTEKRLVYGRDNKDMVAELGFHTISIKPYKSRSAAAKVEVRWDDLYQYLLWRQARGDVKSVTPKRRHRVSRGLLGTERQS